MGTTRSRILNIQQFLETATDQDHPVTMQDILSHLKDEDIPASRKSVTQDIEQLIAAGVGIVCNGGQRNEYFVGDRLFELPELKLLVDAVQASRFIPPQKSADLIGKLTHFASIHQADKLRRTLYTDRQARPKSIALSICSMRASTPAKRSCSNITTGAETKRRSTSTVAVTMLLRLMA